MVNKRVRNAVLGCKLKNDGMIFVPFQSKLFNITVIQVYVPTSNTEEAEVERFYDWLYSLQPKMEKLYTVSKNKTRSWLWLRPWIPYCQIQTEIEESRENH